MCSTSTSTITFLPLIFTSSLKISYRHFLSYSPLPRSFQVHASFFTYQLLYQLCVLKRKPNTACAIHILLNVWPSLDGSLSSTGCMHLKKKKSSLSQLQLAINRTLASGGIPCPPRLCILNFCLTWAFTHLMHTALTVVYSCVQYPLCPENTVSS